MGDGRRREKEVRGAGSGSEIVSRFDGCAVWHDRERERRGQRHWRNTPLFYFHPAQKRPVHSMRVLSRRGLTITREDEEQKPDSQPEVVSTSTAATARTNMLALQTRPWKTGVCWMHAWSQQTFDDDNWILFVKRQMAKTISSRDKGGDGPKCTR